MRKMKTRNILFGNEWYHHETTLNELSDHIQNACDYLDMMDYDVKKAQAEVWH
jgi:exo-beta-1,3-glucanase (GH17 family)